MKIAIIQRKLDGLGRIVVPIEFRKELGIHSDEDVMAYVTEPTEEGVLSVEIESSGSNAAIQAHLGFLILPQTYIHAFDLNQSMMDIWVEKGKLRLRKSIPQCAFTGDTEDLVQYRDTNKYISKQVIRELYKVTE